MLPWLRIVRAVGPELGAERPAAGGDPQPRGQRLDLGRHRRRLVRSTSVSACASASSRVARVRAATTRSCSASSSTLRCAGDGRGGVHARHPRQRRGRSRPRTANTFSPLDSGDLARGWQAGAHVRAAEDRAPGGTACRGAPPPHLPALDVRPRRRRPGGVRVRGLPRLGRLQRVAGAAAGAHPRRRAVAVQRDLGDGRQPRADQPRDAARPGAARRRRARRGGRRHPDPRRGAAARGRRLGARRRRRPRAARRLRPLGPRAPGLAGGVRRVRRAQRGPRQHGVADLGAGAARPRPRGRPRAAVDAGSSGSARCAGSSTSSTCSGPPCGSTPRSAASWSSATCRSSSPSTAPTCGPAATSSSSTRPVGR